MDAKIADAVLAYANAAKATGPGMAAPGSGASFASLLRDTAASAVEAGQHADKISAAAIDGKAGVAEVVTAVANAELTLQTVVAIRDRVVEAYQEILRMPI
ncbi:MAG: flagellar hook-basal body complex protein FliE [Alphaproteobacteria bacterium]